MPVSFKDYYSILGVPKTATQDEIKKAFRKLARACHPDLASAEGKANAESRFKEINEAYEVLKNPETRASYDQLGRDWKRYEHMDTARSGGGPRARGGGGSYEFHVGGTGFSDFFEQFFGGMRPDPFGDFGSSVRGHARRRPGPARGEDAEAEILVTLEEALHGATRRITLSRPDPQNGSERQETLQVTVPAGVREGQRIRLAGQGHPGQGGGPAGDLFLKARFAQHPYFKVKDSDLHYELALAPWEAVLGATVIVPTLRGSARLHVKAGAQDGQQLRLRGHGLPRGDGTVGDLLAIVSIKTPSSVSVDERALWQQLRDRSNFNPRSNL